MSEEHWSYCQAALVEHSRTFAIPIAQLPEGLRKTITCAYLLCRIADTVEDTAAWSASTKERLQRLLLDVLEEDLSPRAFQAAVSEESGGDVGERELLLNLERILSCFATCQEGLVRSSKAWIAELIRGMCIYSRRLPGPDGIVCLESEADLDRYCYFVAGTIGRLLTEGFILETRLDDARAMARLRENAERFAAGLQMVNILRDITADLSRGYCFIPRTVLARAGLRASDVSQEECQERVLGALEGLFRAAREHLEAALEYTLTLPTEPVGVRAFCIIPLWIAVQTLELCRKDPRLLDAQHRVKLSRARVLQLVTECLPIAGDDDALRRSFVGLSDRAELWLSPVAAHDGE